MNNHFDFWLGDDFEREMMMSACSRRKMTEARHFERKIAVMEIGRGVCFGKGGGDMPSPDPQIGQAALKQAQTGQDWLNFAKEQFAIGNIRQEEMDALTKSVTNEQLRQMGSAGDRSDLQWQDYNTTYRPIEKMNVLDSLGGQYLSDDQVREYLGKQDQAAVNRLDAQHKANLAAIQALGAGKASVQGSTGISAADAEAIANSMLGAPPTQAKFTSQPSATYIPGSDGWAFGGVNPGGFDQAGYDQAVANYNASKSSIISKLTGLGSVKGESVQWTDAERNKLIEAEKARHAAALKANTSVADEVMMMRDASRKAQEGAAGEAKADVLKSAEQGRISNQRQMAAMGINPNSGRFAGLDRGLALDTALASAGAQNNARNMVRNQGTALRADQANYGRGGMSAAAQQVGLGLNAGNSAVGNQGASNANFYQNNGIMNAGFGGAMQGYAGQAQTLNQLYGNQLQGWQAQQQANSTSAAGLGSMAGQIAGAGITLY